MTAYPGAVPEGEWSAVRWTGRLPVDGLAIGGHVATCVTTLASLEGLRSIITMMCFLLCWWAWMLHHQSTVRGDIVR